MDGLWESDCVACPVVVGSGNLSQLHYASRCVIDMRESLMGEDTHVWFVVTCASSMN